MTELRKSRANAAKDESVLINSRQVSDLAGGVCLMTIHRWMTSGRIPRPTKIMNRNYWNRAELIAALNSANHPAEPPRRILDPKKNAA